MCVKHLFVYIGVSVWGGFVSVSVTGVFIMYLLSNVYACIFSITFYNDE